MKKIVVTGVAGFIGSNLADALLKNGYKVVGIDNLAYGHRSQVAEGVEFHEMDVRSKDIYPLFDGAEFVFHLAALTSILWCQEDPVLAADNNITGTVNVLEAAKRAGVKKFIYAETSALYEGITKLPTDESEVDPQSYYAVSKLCDHFFAEAYRRFSDIKTVGLRYFNVYGPRQDYTRSMPPVMSAFMVKLLKGERATIYGTGQKKRDFVHVNDVNAFHLLCLESDKVDNQVFNIGSGKNYSVKDIYDLVDEIIGTKLQPELKPDKEGEAEETLADISKAKSMGWEPKMDMRNGLKEMVEHIRKEMAKGTIK
ncbi:MAG: NAD-dependent epimerase/dehydratase family protein [Patescibacteria group bacterium]|nr:NAD-dependent epimerase/dehydratase family protein [Patescibacteria group bacterium]MDE2015271.1 NAD-dependent epimerase/dehydratase family protein [Patescibacteria group bacterium]MDE2227077.1 NAD-dependent epimerase/dehydratase family protein [Patescibacteria group bacterium]